MMELLASISSYMVIWRNKYRKWSFSKGEKENNNNKKNSCYLYNVNAYVEIPGYNTRIPKKVWQVYRIDL